MTEASEPQNFDQQGPQMSDRDVALSGALSQVEASKAEHSERNPTQQVLGLTESGAFVSVVRLGSTGAPGETRYVVQHGDIESEGELSVSEAPGSFSGQGIDGSFSAFSKGSGSIYLSEEEGDNITFPPKGSERYGAKVTFRGEEISELSDLDELMKLDAELKEAQSVPEEPQRKRVAGRIGRLLGRGK